jgi:multiple sugar transport system ATP-binding protein
MAAVVLEHISKVFPGEVHALRDLSLQVAEGELLVLVGPSGCGKTTTLRMIAGLDEPTSGTISIGGRAMNQVPPRERHVAMVFQKPALYPHLSVQRNLGFSINLRRKSSWRVWEGLPWLRGKPSTAENKERLSQQEQIAKTAQLVGLETLLSRLPGQLSGGQQQRVALGRAIAAQPEVFLLDEPLSQLDSQLRAELRHELHLLQRRLRATMIYVTHDQAEAMTLADRVAVLDRGVLQQVDRPLAVYEKPCNRFVAGFLGWPAMNFAEGRLLLIGQGLSFIIEGPAGSKSPAWRLPVPASQAAAWAPYIGQPLTLGIRPEDVRLAQTGETEARLAMEVVLIEPLGHATLVTFERDGWQLTARLPAWRAGDGRLEIVVQRSVEVFFDMERAYLFDRGTGLALPGLTGESNPAG